MECMTDTYNLEAKINKKVEKKAQTNKNENQPPTKQTAKQSLEISDSKRAPYLNVPRPFLLSEVCMSVSSEILFKEEVHV